MMRVALLAGGLGAALMGCEDPPEIAGAEFGEVCGEPGPFRVLPLESDEFVNAYSTIRVGDRSLYSVFRFDPDEPDNPWGTGGGATVWAVGPCGESPVQVASGLSTLFTLDVWPDVVLACDGSRGDLVMLDLTGATEPRVIMPGLSTKSWDCADNWTPFGALNVVESEGEAARLQLHPYPSHPGAEPPAPVVLLDSIRLGDNWGGIVSGEFRYRFGALYTYPDHAFALTDDDALVRVELSDGTVSTVQADVHAFAAAADGETLLWQDRAATSVDSEGNVVSKTYLRVGGRDEDALLGETALVYDQLSLEWVDHAIVTLAFGEWSERSSRLYTLPGLESIALPVGTTLEAPLADGSWIARSDNDSLIHRIEPGENVDSPMFPRPAKLLRIDDDSIVIRELPPCCDETYYDWRSESALWRVSLDGKHAQRLAERATAYMQPIDDERIVTAVDLGANWLGNLVIVDSESGEERRIDERVAATSFDRPLPGEGVITYSVADGARSGIYRARLSAAGGAP